MSGIFVGAFHGILRLMPAASFGASRRSPWCTETSYSRSRAVSGSWTKQLFPSIVEHVGLGMKRHWRGEDSC